MLIVNAHAFLEDSFSPGTQILFREGKILALGKNLNAEGEKILDLEGDFLLPGFVDVHIHAFMGQDTMSGEDAVRHMSRELLKFGVAAFLPTTMSASPKDTRFALKGIQAVMENPEPSGARVLGAHMEAPFLNPTKAGAQRKEFFALPGKENWRAFAGEQERIVRLLTLAPELPGAMELISYLNRRNICVSLGHTNANGATVHKAAENGACHITHTFNAQSPLGHREPGVPGAALTDGRLSCEFIADGIHLHPDIVRLLTRCKGPKLSVAISDAMEATGMPDGTYQLGGQAVYVMDGAARLEDGTLAGSTLTLAKAFENLLAFGVSPADAARMVTATPAESIGNKEYGHLSVGAPAIFARHNRQGMFISAIHE